MEEIQIILAKNLKAIRKKEKLSLEKVSQLTGVSKTMIGQIERGNLVLRLQQFGKSLMD